MLFEIPSWIYLEKRVKRTPRAGDTRELFFFIMNVVILFSFCSEQLSRQQEGYPLSHKLLESDTNALEL